MAYNTYNPYGYYPQYNQMYPNNLQQQVAQVQQPTETPFNEVRLVTGEEAKAYTVFPNRNALLIDKVNKIAYFKSADSLGQSSMKPYRFEEVDEKQPEQPKINLEDYVTTEKLNEVLKTLTDKINARLFELKKDINVKKALEENMSDGNE